MYTIYTFPNCDKCKCAKELFRERNVPYREVCATSDGKKDLRRFIEENKDNLRYESRGNMRFLILPIIVYENGDVRRIHQGIDGLENFLK